MPLDRYPARYRDAEKAELVPGFNSGDHTRILLGDLLPVWCENNTVLGGFGPLFISRAYYGTTSID